MIRKVEIDPLRMVTQRVDIEDLAAIYDKFEKDDGMQKVFVQTKFSAPPAPGTPALKRFTSESASKICP
jgi:hypothetical protein